MDTATGSHPAHSTLCIGWTRDSMVRGPSVGCAALAGRRKTWAKISVLDDPETAFLDVLFVGPKKGFIVGSYGKLFSTSDGEKWSEVVQDDDPHFYQIASAGDGCSG